MLIKKKIKLYGNIRTYIFCVIMFIMCSGISITLSSMANKILDRVTYNGILYMDYMTTILKDIQQAFDNVFMNSYKYAGTRIEVCAECQEEYLIVRIADSGPGVKPEELPVLKEKYKRGSNVSEQDGAGLGLYLTNLFVEKMGGKLALGNGEPGFVVCLYIRLAG